MSMPVASAMAFSVAVAFFFAAFAVIAAAAFALLFVTVTAAALFCMAVVSVAAASTLFVAMTTMAVMVAAAGCGGFNVVFKCAGDERGDGSITVASVAGIKPDVGLCQRLHGARSEAAADHAVDGVLYEKVHHGGVTVAACGNRFGRNDGSVLHNIDLEVGRHAEVLEDGVVCAGNGRDTRSSLIPDKSDSCRLRSPAACR